MIGLYLRVSKADERGGVASKSIEAQRLACQRFVIGAPSLAGHAMRCYVDDGLSGVSMNRPQLHRLLADCKAGTVRCVVVNDLSRLARSYLDAGTVVEQLLPAWGVRFVSVQDGIDTEATVESCTINGTARTPYLLDPDASFMLGVRNIINAWYSMDVSRKVKDSLRTQWLAGTHVQAQVPFGYLYDKRVPGRLAIDPEASAYVRKVFQLAECGLSPGQVACELNREGVPTPAAYIRLRGIPGKGGPWQREHTRWTRDKVRAILKREAYTGTLVAGRTACKGLGAASPRRATPPESHIRIEGAHPAIVSRQQFDKVQRALRLRATVE